MMTGLLVCAAVVLPAAQLGSTIPDSLPGDYAGWAYQHGGGDFPLRLSIRKDGDGLSLLLDAPHQKAYRLTTSEARFSEGRLQFQRRNSAGNLWAYELSTEGSVLRGKATLDGKDACKVELHRSAEPFAAIPPDSYKDFGGQYRLSAERTLVVTSWFWGELIVTDTGSGRSATMFPVGESDFLVGTSMYVPTQVYARASFRRGPSGSPEGLVWTESGKSPQAAQRIAVHGEETEFSNGSVTLRGTLLKPPGNGPFPAIILLGGSNWEERSAVRDEADYFTSMGLAALIFDKRGCGKSTGDAVASFEEIASDARAAVAWLGKRKDIVASKIGLWGASRGGWVAPLAASKCPDVAFLVLFVAPGVSPAKQETTRRLNEFRMAGYTMADLDEAALYLQRLWKSTDSDDAWAEYETHRAVITGKGWEPYLWGMETKDSDDYRWSKLNMRYDPIPALERLTCPVLALFGELDSNVVPNENIPPMRAALSKAGNKDHTLKVIPRANHGMQVVPEGILNPGQAIHLSVGYAPEVWSGVRTWLEQRGMVNPARP